MSIRLGYQIPNFTYPGTAADIGPTVIAQAREAEASGFDTVAAEVPSGPWWRAITVTVVPRVSPLVVS